MTQNNSKPRTSVIVSLPIALLLIASFFMPWLKVSCNAGQFTKTMQGPNATPMAAQTEAVPEITAKIGQASGWELAGGNISLEAACAQQNNPIGSDKQPDLKNRTWLYLALVLPVLALLIGWFGVRGKATAGTVGTWLLLIGVAGTVIILMAASIDYVDDAMDQAANGSNCGQTPCPAAMQETKSQMKKFVKTKGTFWLWGSLGMYVLLVGCGIAARSTPLGPVEEEVEEQESLSAPTFGNSMPSAGMRTPGQEAAIPNFGPDLNPTTKDPPLEK